MDVLRRELQEVFHRHEFRLSALSEADIEACRRFISASTAISQGCAILSDLATNGSYFAIGRLVDILGLHGEVPEEELIDIDEDFIYRRIHPEDLVDKRMLELRFFEKAADLSAEERLKYHATCRIRMQKAGICETRFLILNYTQEPPQCVIWGTDFSGLYDVVLAVVCLGVALY